VAQPGCCPFLPKLIPLFDLSKSFFFLEQSALRGGRSVLFIAFVWRNRDGAVSVSLKVSGMTLERGPLAGRSQWSRGRTPTSRSAAF